MASIEIKTIPFVSQWHTPLVCNPTKDWRKHPNVKPKTMQQALKGKGSKSQKRT